MRSGPADRTKTALQIAQWHYSGFSDLNETAQEKVVAYIESLLPADLKVGTKIELHGFILMTDATMSKITQITDYSIRQIGAEGLPVGSVQTYVARAGDTLQAISQMYFGSTSYWYLIADANGLTGAEPLTEGTTIVVPNKVANSVNTADTFKVYNQSEIIGTTSPEVRVNNKKSFWQKLIQVVIVIILVVVAIIVAWFASYALEHYATGAALLYAAMFGAVAYAGASVVTQQLAIAAHLQEDFSWKAVGKAAVSGAAAGFTAAAVPVWANTGNWALNAVVRVGVAAGQQLVVDGKITNYAGLVAAATGALDGMGKEGEALRTIGKWASTHQKAIGAGLRLLESAVNGKGDNALSWVELASASLLDSGAVGQDLMFRNGDMNWRQVAVTAIGTAVVRDSMGIDAALNYLGGAIGSGLGGMVGQAFAKTYLSGDVPAAPTTGDFARMDRANNPYKGGYQDENGNLISDAEQLRRVRALTSYAANGYSDPSQPKVVSDAGPGTDTDWNTDIDWNRSLGFGAEFARESKGGDTGGRKILLCATSPQKPRPSP